MMEPSPILRRWQPAPPSPRILRLVATLLLVAWFVGGCEGRRPEPAECCPCGPASGAALDERLLSMLAAARAYHHQADLYLQQGESAEATTALRALLALDLDQRWPEAEEVRLDATARLAKLMLATGAEGDALALADEALAKVGRDSFYLANLHGVRGEILEARAKRLRAGGDEPQAQAAARAAIAAFEQSITINKRLQQQLSGKRGKQP